MQTAGLVTPGTVRVVNRTLMNGTVVRPRSLREWIRTVATGGSRNRRVMRMIMTIEVVEGEYSDE